MPKFESLKQAFYLWTQSGRKKTAFRDIARKYGVPDGWHEYKNNRLREMGLEPTPELLKDISNFGLERAKNRINKWEKVLKGEIF